MTNKNYGKTTILFTFLALFVLPVLTHAQNVGEVDFIAPEIYQTTTYPTETYQTTTYPTETYQTTTYPGYSYDTYSTPGYGYDYYSTSPSYYSTSPNYYATIPNYYSTPSYYSAIPTYHATTPGYVSPGVAAAPTYTYSPTNTTITETTSTWAPSEVYTYAPTSTWAPTDIYSPTEVYTYSPTTVSNYSPTSVYAPSDSHDYAPTTVTTDSHNYTGPVTISVVSQAPAQSPVQYVSGGGTYFNNSPSYYNTPSYFPPAPAPSCRIVASGGYGSGYGYNAVVLSWNSTNANSGYISPLVGTVAPSGSTTVYPNANTLYTLTVSGNGGTSSCQTYAGSSAYVAPAAPVYTTPVVTQTAAVAPYVALTQIPYTGFDFGTFGNAIYWFVLAGFAVAASYLVLYFRGGAFALVGSMFRGAKKTAAAPNVEVIRSASAHVTVAETKNTSSAVENNFKTDARGTLRSAQGGTKDSMISIGSEEGGRGPRIVILRS